MTKRRISLPQLFAVLLLPLAAACSASAPEPYGPVPTEAQLAWQRMEINMFCHFGPNTFSGAEWGTGREAVETFRPHALDCDQWVDVAQQAGMGGIILTAKHHDGFCLWPSAFSTHTVADSLDVLRQFVDACRGKVKAGVYISPWDRNHPTYGTSEYNTVFSNTLREVHTKYGPFFEQWFDGACGKGPNGKKQVYDWPLFNATVLGINPQAVIFSDWGPGCRWVGNEEGCADETCMSTLGDTAWVPAECDVSIRPGWFWHPGEHPKTVDQLMEIYFNSVGRNGLLLLNVPPDTNGRISSEDSAVLVAFRAERDRIFGHDLARGARVSSSNTFSRNYRAKNVLDTAYHTYWAAKDTLSAILSIEFDTVTKFDIIVIQEYIPLGQRITHVKMLHSDGELYSFTPLCTTVGYKRIIRLDEPLSSQKIDLFFEAVAPPVINRIELYNSAR